MIRMNKKQKLFLGMFGFCTINYLFGALIMAAIVYGVIEQWVLFPTLLGMMILYLYQTAIDIEAIWERNIAKSATKNTQENQDTAVGFVTNGIKGISKNVDWSDSHNPNFMGLWLLEIQVLSEELL